jgi:Holliday junction resolvase RusA-like endonuclease
MLPPTVNHMYVSRRGGGKALTEEARTFRHEVWCALFDAGLPRVPPAGDLAVTVRLTYGDRRRTDIDNRVKAALDALATALEFDDARVARLVVERAGYAKGKPACELVLEVLP